MFSFDESTEISARFHRKVLRKDLFTKITSRKNVHVDFYGYLDVNFAVSVFDPNKVFLLSVGLIRGQTSTTHRICYYRSDY